MKIVILDSETVSRNDVSLEGIIVLGESIVYGFTPNEQVAEKIGDADAVICNKCLITEEVFSKCKNLKYVGLFATGYNNVDLSAADRHDAVVCNVPAYSTNAVAQHTFALILNYFSKIRDYAEKVDEKMINAESLGMMKKSAFFVNTARGGLVDEKALAQALENEVIAGAGIDVLTNEPMSEDCPLRNAKNCTVTPHIAWAPKQTRERLLETVAQNLKMWIEGTPQNVVNGK